jgi:hypothetical protein
MKIIIDHQQKRLDQDRLNISCAAEDFDRLSRNNVYLEPINGFALLKPHRFDYESWYSSNSGNYTKTPLSAFSGAVTGFETQLIPAVAAGPWLSTIPVTGDYSAATGVIYTTESFDANRGFCLSVFNYGGGTDAVVAVFGVGTSSVSSSGFFTLDINGEIVYYRNGSEYHRDTITSASTEQGSKAEGTFFEIAVIPYKDKILVWSQNGGSFEINVSGTVLPAGNWFIETGPPVLFQHAPLTFYTAGDITTDKMMFTVPPASATLEEFENDSWIGTQDYRVYGLPNLSGSGNVTVTLENWTGSTFTPNGSNKEAKLKFDITSTSSFYTPVLIGGQVAYPASYTNTASGPVDITCFVSTATLDVPEDPRGVRFTCTITEVASAMAAIPQLSYLTYRPIKVLDDDDIVIFDGVVTSVDVDRRRNQDFINIEAGDGFEALNQYIFTERIPLAKENLYNVINFFNRKWNDTTPVISSSNLYLPWAQAREMDDWGLVVNVGETAADALVDVMDTYAGNWVYGYRPTTSGMVFHAQDLGDLPTSGAVIYESRELALSEGGTGAVDDVWYNLDFDVIPPEANAVFVTGRNPITDTLFQVKKVDAASADPSTAIASRPVNWTGFYFPYALIDPAITSIEAANYACNVIYARITQPRSLIGWTSKYLKYDGLPIWKGDVVKEFTEDADYRVTSLNITWVQDEMRAVEYTAEKI